MPRQSTQAGKLGDLRRFLAALDANVADLAHLEVPRVKLKGLLTQAVQIDLEQSVRTAAKQEATKQLKLLLIEAERLSTVLRFSIKEHYGIRSEKLAEFGLQPFRGVTRKPKPAPESPGAPTPTPPPSGQAAPPSSPAASPGSPTAPLNIPVAPSGPVS